MNSAKATIPSIMHNKEHLHVHVFCYYLLKDEFNDHLHDCNFMQLSGYDLHYYLLGSLGAAEYRLGEPVQKVILPFLVQRNSDHILRNITRESATSRTETKMSRKYISVPAPNRRWAKIQFQNFLVGGPNHCTGCLHKFHHFKNKTFFSLTCSPHQQKWTKGHEPQSNQFLCRLEYFYQT